MAPLLSESHGWLREDLRKPGPQLLQPTLEAWDTPAAKQYLKRFATTYEWSGVSPPEYHQVEQFLACAPHSASRPDGLPYIAWFLAGPAGYQTLWRVICDLMNGLSIEISFNDSAMLFPAKGDLDGDTEEVIRAPVDTRPLNLKNTDNKTCTSIFNTAVQPAISKGAHYTQRGFVPGRQLLQNVVDLDYHNRAQSIAVNAAHPVFDPKSVDPAFQVAVLVFFDFATAFASIAHEFIFLVLRFANAPDWFINFVRSLYSFNHTFQMTADGKHLLFNIMCGVLQGCPLSSTLFVMCINPFLEHMDQSIFARNLGVVRACADDVGAALKSFHTLSKLHLVFQWARRISNLTLKPIKCNLVPCSLPWSEALSEFISVWIQDKIPEWRGFRVVRHAKYFGFLMGPKIKDAQWSGVLDKCLSRGKAIADSHACPSISTFAYNFISVPVLTYRGQLLILPHDIEMRERHLLHFLWHMPTNTFELDTFMSINTAGPRCFKSVRATCKAAMFRTAFKTISGWEAQLASLQNLVLDYLPGSTWSFDILAPGFWDTPAYV